MSVRAHAGDIELIVRDDGSGFDPGAATEGFGLLGLRERAALVGGALEVQSVLAAGTTRGLCGLPRHLHGSGRGAGGIPLDLDDARELPP